MSPMSTSAHEENLLSAIGAQTKAITAVAQEAYAQGQRDGQRELLAAINELRDELLDQISGYDEDKAHDQMISGWIRMLDNAIAGATT